MEISSRIKGQAPQTIREKINKSKRKASPSKEAARVDTRDSFQSAASSSYTKVNAASPVFTGKTQKTQLLPADRAWLVQKGPEDKYTVINKIPCDNPENITPIFRKDGDEQLLFTSGGRHTINVATKQGDLVARWDLPGKERAGQILYDSKNDSLYARTGTTVYSIDPDGGKIKSKYNLSNFGFNRYIFLDKNCRLNLVEDNQLKILDKNLKQKSSTSIGFIPDKFHYLPDGSLVLVNDSSPSHVHIQDKSGKVILSENRAKLNSIQITDRGEVTFLRDKDLKSEVVKYDPQKGEVQTFSTTKDASAVASLGDGSTIVFDDRLSNPRLICYSADGDAKWNFSFDRKGHLRQTYITADDQYIYAVLAEYTDDKPEPTSYLYRVKNDERGSILSWVTKSLTGIGSSKKGKMLYSSEGDSKSFIPAVLDDGRMVIFDKGKIHLLSPKGEKIKSFSNVDKLLNEVLKKSKVVTRRVRTSVTSTGDLPADKKAVLLEAKRRFAKEHSGVYASSNITGFSEKYGFSATDSTINFRHDLDQKEALQILGIQNKENLGKMLEQDSLLNFVLKDRIDLKFPDPTRGEVRVGPNKLEVVDPGSGKLKSQFRIEKNSRYTCVLLVSIGKHDYVFAGDSNGIVHWYDANSATTKQTYEMGNGIKNVIAGKDRILAVDSKQNVLCIKPKFEKQEQMKVSGMEIKAGESMPVKIEDEKQKIVIDKRSGTINIGGVKLPINPGKNIEKDQG